jgi:CheY-like chemotaxis protein
MRILVVGSQEVVSRSIMGILGEKGHECLQAETPAEALALCQSLKPEMALVDLRIDGVDPLDILKAIRSECAARVILVMTAFGSHDLVVQALKHGATDYLKKPFRPSELLTLVDRFAAIIAEMRERREITSFLTGKTLRFSMANTISLPGRMAAHLVAEAAPFLGEDELMGIRLGLEELLINAVEHGNLAIGTDEKKSAIRERGTVLSLVEERLSHPHLAARRVGIDATLGPEQCEWVITDEGSGFDHENLPDPTSEQQIEEVCGRGIFLARFQFTELEYNSKGNSVRALRIPGRNPPLAF